MGSPKGAGWWSALESTSEELAKSKAEVACIAGYETDMLSLELREDVLLLTLEKIFRKMS